jgi:N-acetylglucosaminyldiphosphoundecaprenol N-acetyl-beta-D-mannosaminyltransferase
MQPDGQVCELCGLPVSCNSLDTHVRDLVGHAEQGIGAWLVTLNTEMIARGVREPDYWDLIKQADIITADGMPLVWASTFKSKKTAIAGRTTGVDMVDAMLRRASVPRFAVIGGKNPKETVKSYGQQAMEACAFVFDGKVDLSGEQMSFFCDELALNRVRVVFVALGVPRQDRLALLLRHRMPHLVVLGIGGTFEILGPEGGRAPQWMQKSGLEWLYRLVKEPQRLWHRYLINYPQGIWRLVKDCIGVGR